MSSPAAAASSAPAVQPLAADHTLLYLSNLPFTLTQEALQQFIAAQANAQVTGVTIVMRKGKEGPRSRGIGFVQVPNAQKDAVLALTGKDLDGRLLDVQIAKVQVAGGGERAPREPKKERAPAQPRAPREANADGSSEAPSASSRRRNRRKGAAAAGANGAAPAASSAAASSEPRAPKAFKRQSTIPDADHTLLYVNNLSFDATSEDVSKLFSDRLGAAPKEVELVLSKFGRFKGRSRGFAFVTVQNSQVQNALGLAGTQFQERDIGVAPAKDKADQ